MRLTQGIIILLFFPIILLSQPASRVQYTDLLPQMESDLQQGRKQTLRDLGGLLDKPKVKKQARQLLQKYTHFTNEEIDLEKASKQEFLDFYYDHYTNFNYSQLLHAYYLTPLESRKVDFEIRSLKKKSARGGNARQLFVELDEELTAAKYDKVADILDRIAWFPLEETEEMLIGLLQDERLFEAPATDQKGIYQKTLKMLEGCGELEVVEIVLQMMEVGLLETDFSTPLLTNMTNVSPELGTRFEDEASFYQFLVDSLETLDDIRIYGYDRIFNFRLNFFQHPVDYYGKIIGLSDEYPWIKYNALKDVQRTHDSRGLFYLAADFYRSRYQDNAFDADYYFETIQKQLNVEVGIKDQHQRLVFKPLIDDEQAMLNYLTYWASRYADFEWDDNRQVFTNKLETLAKTQNYERLFRRLNSRNDTVAIQSFLVLTEGDPVEIKSLARKYRQLLRNHNAQLPSMKYKYLEQLAILTDYCRKNQHVYRPNSRLKSYLEDLLTAETPQERYEIENKLIKNLIPSQVTALEYWGCLYEGRKEISFSVGRVLDWFYSKHWENILEDPNQLRLYLKKSYILENIGAVGICNAYLNKFDLDDPLTQEVLKEVAQLEADEDILNQVYLLLIEEPDDDLSEGYALDDFIHDPLLFSSRDMKILPPPSLEELERMVALIKRTEDMEVIRQLFTYLRQHPNPDFVPILFQLIDDERVVVRRKDITVKVGDNIIPIIESIYDHKVPVSNPSQPFAREYWATLWKERKDTYTDWASIFFQERLDSLQDRTIVRIEELNELADSPHFTAAHKPIMLKSLKKVKPIKNIRRLYIEPRLAVEEDLVYFRDFYFSYKELDDIPKLFDIQNENAEQMLAFLEEKSANFDGNEKGSFYNNLFRQPWLSRYVDSGSMSLTLSKQLKETLEFYLNESDFLSEYEEQTTILHIAQLDFIGKNLEEKLSAALELDLDKSAKAKILQSIIATVRYEEIGVVAPFFDRMSNVLEAQTYTFLNQDFGLPIFSIDSHKELEKLLRNHEKMTEQEFYFHYLKEFGVDFTNKKKELDFQKIHDILQYDIISPFVGSAGGKRDDYIYGIIKILELKFNTRLGFHEKLNEFQTFYNFSSSKRAQAWIAYLREQHLIDDSYTMPPSFNQGRGPAVQ